MQPINVFRCSSQAISCSRSRKFCFQVQQSGDFMQPIKKIKIFGETESLRLNNNQLKHVRIESTRFHSLAMQCKNNYDAGLVCFGNFIGFLTFIFDFGRLRSSSGCSHRYRARRFRTLVTHEYIGKFLFILKLFVLQFNWIAIDFRFFQFSAKQMVMLDISFNHFETVHPSILEFPNLKVLYLHGNRIQKLVRPA